MTSGELSAVLEFVKTASVSDAEAIARACAARVEALRIDLNDDEINAIKKGEILNAIKSYRMRNGVSLVTAKNAIDAWRSNNPGAAFSAAGEWRETTNI